MGAEEANEMKEGHHCMPLDVVGLIANEAIMGRPELHWKCSENAKCNDFISNRRLLARRLPNAPARGLSCKSRLYRPPPCHESIE